MFLLVGRHVGSTSGEAQVCLSTVGGDEMILKGRRKFPRFIIRKVIVTLAFDGT
jgi:hypothetical protein